MSMLKSFVDGTWTAGTGREVTDTNPARPDDVLATFRLIDADEATRAVEVAARASPGWRATPFHERGAILARAAALLDERADRYGSELTREEGKTLAEGIGEVRRAAQVFRYYAAEANQPQGAIYAAPRAGEQIWSVSVPVGVVALITPWNFPIAIPAWKLAPAVAYGNTVVWKPASLVPLIAVRLVEVLEQAGMPPGACNLVLGDGRVGSALVANPLTRACSFTGSTEVGKRLVALGAETGTKIQAEMGGKNAAIVLGDADIDLAVDQVLSGAMKSTGQKCTATSRAVVERAVHDEFVGRLAERVRTLRVGDPSSPDTYMGPLASSEQHTSVLEYLQIGAQEGARAVVGGNGIDSDDGGYFVEPTVFVDVRPDHRIYLEEVFGPVLAVVPADDGDDAFDLANRGPYGLSGGIFTRDLGRVLEAVEKFDVGVLHVNSETPGADPHVPFGGMKDSGTSAREMGKAARDFYTESKTVYVRAGG